MSKYPVQLGFVLCIIGSVLFDIEKGYTITAWCFLVYGTLVAINGMANIMTYGKQSGNYK